MVWGGKLGRYVGLAQRIVAAAAVCVVLPTVSAEASARMCRQLEAQLAALPKTGKAGSTSQIRKYDAAIARQQEQIRKARAQLQQNSCTIGLSVVSGVCGQVRGALARMEKNLADLQRIRAKLGSGGSQQERNRILRALQSNDCRPDTTPVSVPKHSKAPAREQQVPGPAQRKQAAVAPRRPTGNLRTMCVRTCDGYYFPISWSVSAEAFKRDEYVCASMCPGVETELYYHHVPHEETDRMVSARTGMPYTQMHFAYRYKNPDVRPPQGCTCSPQAAAVAARGYTIIGGSYEANGVTSELKGSVMEFGQPAVEPEPEGEEVVEETSFGEEEPVESSGPPRRERPIRVVGPAFLPDPESEEAQPAQDHGPAL